MDGARADGGADGGGKGSDNGRGGTICGSSANANSGVNGSSGANGANGSVNANGGSGNSSVRSLAQESIKSTSKRDLMRTVQTERRDHRKNMQFVSLTIF